MTATRNRHGSATVDLPSDTEIVITRQFDAPAALVFKATTTPELVQRWWGFDSSQWLVCEIDLRVGGTWRYLTREEGGFEVGFHGEYREIEPEWKTVQTFAVEGMYDGQYSVETLTLEEVDGKTLYKVVSTMPDIAARDGMLQSGMEVGVVQGFERLDAILVELKAGEA